MSQINRRSFLKLTATLGICSVVPRTLFANTSRIEVDFTDGWLYFNSHRYPVVLPRSSNFALQQVHDLQEVHGALSGIDYKPAWGPTPRMRRNDPTLPAVVPYGHPRHALGIYRIRINWSGSSQYEPLKSGWKYVRIHGGAYQFHLHENHSAGCIRMRDDHITELVQLIGDSQPEIVFLQRRPAPTIWSEVNSS